MKLDYETRVWWSCLKGIAVFNLTLWVVTAVITLLLPINHPMNHHQQHEYQLWHCLLSLIYTVVCAFRSFYPRIDLERTVLVDHWLSSIALGRASATLAEMACASQVGLFLWRIGDNHALVWPQYVGLAVVVLVLFAQCCCWAGVLTLNHWWHAGEESLWALCAVLVGGVAVEMFYFGVVTCVSLTLAMFLCVVLFYVTAVVDVPMYIRRASRLHQHQNHAKTNNRKQFRSFSEGMRSATFERVPTGTWDVWMHEVGWMTPYFSLAVWGSIGLVWMQ